MCSNLICTFWCLILASLAIMASAKDTFPAPLKRCRVDDEPCFVEQAQSYFRNFKHGLPERQLDPVEPLQMGELRISSGQQHSGMQFSLVMTNTSLHNFGNSVVVKSLKGFNKDLSKPVKLILNLAMSELEVHAKYDVNGKILVLPIISKGDIVIKLSNVVAKSRILAEPVKRADGHSYLKLNDYKTVTKVGAGHFDMSDLFKDNKELRDSTLKVLNDDWEALSQDVQPKINEALDRVFKVNLQRLWDNIPYDEFFLEN